MNNVFVAIALSTAILCSCYAGVTRSWETDSSVGSLNGNGMGTMQISSGESATPSSVNGSPDMDTLVFESADVSKRHDTFTVADIGIGEESSDPSRMMDEILTSNMTSDISIYEFKDGTNSSVRTGNLKKGSVP